MSALKPGISKHNIGFAFPSALAGRSCHGGGEENSRAVVPEEVVGDISGESKHTACLSLLLPLCVQTCVPIANYRSLKEGINNGRKGGTKVWLSWEVGKSLHGIFLFCVLFHS